MQHNFAPHIISLKSTQFHSCCDLVTPATQSCCPCNQELCCKCGVRAGTRIHLRSACGDRPDSLGQRRPHQLDYGWMWRLAAPHCEKGTAMHKSTLTALRAG